MCWVKFFVSIIANYVSFLQKEALVKSNEVFETFKQETEKVKFHVSCQYVFSSIY